MRWGLRSCSYFYCLTIADILMADRGERRRDGQNTPWDIYPWISDAITLHTLLTWANAFSTSFRRPQPPEPCYETWSKHEGGLDQHCCLARWEQDWSPSIALIWPHHATPSFVSSLLCRAKHFWLLQPFSCVLSSHTGSVRWGFSPLLKEGADIWREELTGPSMSKEEVSAHGTGGWDLNRVS